MQLHVLVACVVVLEMSESPGTIFRFGQTVSLSGRALSYGADGQTVHILMIISIGTLWLSA